MKLSIIILSCLLIFSSVYILEASSATSFSFIEKLTAGDNTSYNLVLENTDNRDILCGITTSITPDGEGIDVTYSSNSFTIRAKSTYTLTVHINTSWALMENIYIITTSISTESLGSYSTNVKIIEGGSDPEPEVEPDPEVEPEEPKDEGNNKIEISGKSTPLWPRILAAIIIFIIMLIVLFKYEKKSTGEKK